MSTSRNFHSHWHLNPLWRCTIATHSSFQYNGQYLHEIYSGWHTDVLKYAKYKMWKVWEANKENFQIIKTIHRYTYSFRDTSELTKKCSFMLDIANIISLSDLTLRQVDLLPSLMDKNKICWPWYNKEKRHLLHKKKIIISKEDYMFFPISVQSVSLYIFTKQHIWHIIKENDVWKQKIQIICEARYAQFVCMPKMLLLRRCTNINSDSQQGSSQCLAFLRGGNEHPLS